MASPALEARLTVVTSVLSDHETDVFTHQVLRTGTEEPRQSILDASNSLADENLLSAEKVKRVKLANDVAEISMNDIDLIKSIDENTEVNSLSDAAFQYSLPQIAQVVGDTVTNAEKENLAITISRNLYVAEPTATVAGLVAREEIPIGDENLRNGIVAVLEGAEERAENTLNITSTPIAEAVEQDDSVLKHVPPEDRDSVVAGIKILQRTTAIAPTPQAVAALTRHKISSATEVLAMNEATFVDTFKTELEVKTAKEVYANALIAQHERQSLIMSALDASAPGFAAMEGFHSPKQIEKKAAKSGRLTKMKSPSSIPPPAPVKHLSNAQSKGAKGVTAEMAGVHSQTTPKQQMDLRETVEKRAINIRKILEKHKITQLNMDTMFDENDEIVCEDCSTVYSPGAYLVDLLQFLRRTSAATGESATSLPNDQPYGNIRGTALDLLFRRRPDLRDLELSCANTETVLPYVDLANEIMESFIVNLTKFVEDAQEPKQAVIKAFNSSETGKEDEVWQPQNTDKLAYLYVAHAAYPINLPYSQPLDVIRVNLGFLDIDLSDLYKVFRPKFGNLNSLSRTSEENLEEIRLNRRYDAAVLQLVEEEYVILTEESFASKKHYEALAQKELSDEDFHAQIGLVPLQTYYGYNDLESLRSTNTDERTGLCWVRDQLLRRTNITWVDLVEIMQTAFMNPLAMTGKNAKILRNVRVSYRYLQTLVDPSKVGLEPYHKVGKYVASLIQGDSSTKMEIENWIKTNFKAIGKIIVLESNEGPYLQFKGSKRKIPDLVIRPELKVGKSAPTSDKQPPKKAILRADGLLVNEKGDLLGNVDVNGRLLVLSGQTTATTIVEKFRDYNFSIHEGDSANSVGIISSLEAESPGRIMQTAEEALVTWTESVARGGGSSINNVTLVHLDGEPLDDWEWASLHKFVRLWKKFKWSVREVDMALIGLQPADGNAARPVISPELLHELVHVCAIVNLTGFSVERILTLWAQIPIHGEGSLYKRLFFKRKIPETNNVFAPDENGYYLTDTRNISDNMMLLSASLGISTTDILIAIRSEYLPLEDELDLDNVSALYRYVNFCRILDVSMTQLSDLFRIFAGYFSKPSDTLDVLKTWAHVKMVGFSFHEFDYVIQDVRDITKHLSVDKVQVMLICKQLQQDIRKISDSHSDIKSEEQATRDFIRAKASLIYDENIVERILRFLDGTTDFRIAAPKWLDLREIPEDLKDKIKYVDHKNDDAATLQVTGILTPTQLAVAEGLVEIAGVIPSSVKDQMKVKEDWRATLKEASKKARFLLDNNTFGLSLKEDKILMMGDTTGTAATKQAHFIKIFLPYLRQRLSQTKIVEIMKTFGALPNASLASTLLNILETQVHGKTQSSLIALMALGAMPRYTPATKSWKGFLLPSQTDEYIFSTIAKEKPAGFYLDNKSITFEDAPEDSPNFFSTGQYNPLRLDAQHLYFVEIYGIDINNLKWQTSTMARSLIPDNALIPDFSQFHFERLFNRFRQMALIVNKFKICEDEILYIRDHAELFSDFRFESMNLAQWKRLHSFTTFRDSLPKSDVLPLQHFLNWAKSYKTSLKEADPERIPSSASVSELLTDKISAATGWNPYQVQQVLEHADFFDGDISVFSDERALMQVSAVLEFVRKSAVDIPRLYKWTALEALQLFPSSSKTPVTQRQLDFEGRFSACHDVAKDVQLAVRSKLSPESYSTAIKPLNDVIRERQRDAMIAYLLSQDEILENGIVDADGLFDFFLIDVQMTPLVETSRIKQAISTVQLYVQRCLLALEPYVDRDRIDRPSWDWLRNHTTWAANRKVFLYPENYIEPSLRDDKSPFFKEFEEGLLQNDLTRESILASVKTYLSKVADVANLLTVAIHFEQVGNIADENKTIQKVHLFGRTKTAPFGYFHRNYNLAKSQWTPWTKIDIEIPHYMTDTGCPVVYLVPFVWNNRMLLFIPQISKITVPVDLPDESTLGTLQTTRLDTAPRKVLEIQMSWSEYTNGKWSPRQLVPDRKKSEPLGKLKSLTTKEGHIEDVDSLVFSPVLAFPESPVVSAKADRVRDIQDAKAIRIFVCMKKGSFDDPDGSDFKNGPAKKIGEFIFVNGELGVDANNDSRNEVGGPSLSPQRWETSKEGGQVFDIDGLKSIYSTQGKIGFGETAITTPFLTHTSCVKNVSSTNYTAELVLPSSEKNLKVYSEHAVPLMNSLMSTDGLTALYELLRKLQSEDVYGGPLETAHELGASYSLYYWELGLHAPLAIANQLLQAQQFEQALAVCHHVFDPLERGEVDDPSRFWKFAPFKKVKKQTLEQYYLKIVASNLGNGEKAVKEWTENPFQPHLVARSRPIAYMKWVVAKYIEILVAYGDSYFRQNTLESIPNAIQMYILASHLYGPRGQLVPRRKDYKPETYGTLLAKQFDAFSNAMVELEEVKLFSNQTALTSGLTAKGNESLLSVFGAASTLYFGVPSNPKMRQLGSTIDDRLFKIRHSQDINGVVRKLALFEPPIDPSLLIQAKAQGIQISSVLAGIDGPMPNYRFQYLLNRAIELTIEVKAIGNSMLSAKEKLDSEAYTNIRARHETVAMGTLIEIKRLALEEAQTSLDALEASRKTPLFRLQFYLQLLGLDNTAVPTTEADFQELPTNIEKAIDDAGIKMLPSEKSEKNNYVAANALNIAVGSTETLSSFFFALPSVATHATPMGVGAAVKWGPPNIGHASQAVARGLRIGADVLTYDAMTAGRKANALRGMHDRILQANQAGYEIKQIDKQILSAKVRLNMAEQEIRNQQKSIDQAHEMEDFLRSKFSSTELYTWLSSTTMTMYHELYNQAYDLATKAVKTFKYERPQDQVSYLQPGYWDTSRNGLLCGEQLHLALKKLEKAYIENRSHDFEITKHTSLRQTDPMALIVLRETGACDFNVPETLFDMDFPGHYLRRLKSVSLTVPCIIGPYTSINCTLRMTSHKYRTSPSAKSPYSEDKAGTGDERFSTANVPITAVAISSAQEDSGQFEVSFHDERYIPFEGAGAISTWHIEFPGQLRQFPYESISDVVLHLRYTSLDGGEALKKAACESLEEKIMGLGGGEGLHALMDVKNDFSTEWAAVDYQGADEGAKTILLSQMDLRLPMFTRGRIARAKEITIVSDSQIPLPVTIQGVQLKGLKVGNARAMTAGAEEIKETEVNIAGTWTLTTGPGKSNCKRIWLLVRYILLTRP